MPLAVLLLFACSSGVAAAAAQGIERIKGMCVCCSGNPINYAPSVVA
jgi:hypothetical protein